MIRQDRDLFIALTSGWSLRGWYHTHPSAEVKRHAVSPPTESQTGARHRDGLDRCVRCGLCLPHCPTYSISRDEGEGPRGRIELMTALSEDPGLGDDPRLRWHLDGCTGCLSCETVCPAGVPFGDLIRTARAGHPPRRATTRSLMRLVRSPRAFRWLGHLTAWARRLGLLGLARTLPSIRAWADRAPERVRPRATRPRSEDAGAGILLFGGCVGDALDGATLDHATAVLERLGHRVAPTPTGSCCGALHDHNGDPGSGGALRDDLAAALVEDQRLVSVATGCAVSLREHPRLATAHVDIMDLLLALDPAELPLRDGPTVHVATYLPCTARYLGMDPATLTAWTDRLPSVSAVALSSAPGCCGGAGAYMLEQPERSRRLGEELLQALPEEIDTVLVPNLGCAIQLRATAARRGRELHCMHPVSFLASRLE